MTKYLTGRKHTRGTGRIYTGVAITGIALFWLAKKVGWIGAGSSGLFWPLLVLGLGLTMVLIGRGHHRRIGRCAAQAPKGGGA